MKVLGAMALAFALLAATPVYAQQQNFSPEQLKQTMGVMFQSMIELFASPEMARASARYYKALFDALVAEGFTKEQAMRIIEAQPLPISPKN